MYANMNNLLINTLFDKFTLTKHNIICYIVFEVDTIIMIVSWKIVVL